MKRPLLIAIIIIGVFFVPRYAFSQMEFIELGQKALVGSLEYTTENHAQGYGVEGIYTNDGRIGLGLLYGQGFSGASTVATSIGVEGIASILNPSTDFPFGLEALASYAITSVSFGTYTAYSGNTAGFGGETYLRLEADSSFNVEPFFSIMRSFSKVSSGNGIYANGDATSYSAGADFVIRATSKFSFVLVPGAIFQESETDFGLSAYFVYHVN